MNAPTILQSAIEQLTHVPLSALDHDDQVNARKAGKGAERDFVANIRAKGVLVPLLVRPSGNRFKVTDGSKRLAALYALRDAGEIDGDFKVPVEIRAEDDAAARETSLATNIVRVPMHPADQYEAFAALVKDGMDPKDISARYAMTDLQVQQVLALGALSPRLRDAWRKGILDARHARAFTLAPDQKTQDRVFDKLRKTDDDFNEYDVRSELKVEDKRASALVEFVGVEAYAAAGGQVTRDLFGPHHIVGDEKLAKKLAAEKLQQECARLVSEEGWAWAAPIDDLPQGARYNWRRSEPQAIKFTSEEEAALARLQAIQENADAPLEDVERAEEEEARLRTLAERRAYSERQKAASGCILEIDRQGELEIRFGVIKPRDEKLTGKAAAAAPEAKAKPKEKREPVSPAEALITNGLSEQLAETLTAAAAKALAQDPGLALDALLAGLAVNGGLRSTVAVQRFGMGHDDDEPAGEFREFFARVRRMSNDQKLKEIARFTAGMLDFRGCNRPDEPGLEEDHDVAAIVNALDPKHFNEAARKLFDAEAYFAAASKPVCIRAIAEAISGDEAHKAAGLQKKVIAAYCVKHIPKTGWLPLELRAAGYDGPKGKFKAKAPAKKKPAKKKAKGKRK